LSEFGFEAQFQRPAHVGPQFGGEAPHIIPGIGKDVALERRLVCLSWPGCRSFPSMAKLDIFCLSILRDPD
jgi:hypothetical protein